ncbi:hypothetical protein [Saccharothrix sp.]|uniref:sunset domain-containing protein n=1 Tax=Saccharothrix sp. TaxID=1873460 RepID=UPI002810BBCE|nr:hypothetical protein [Saccharothrix sp.]
MFWLFAQMFVLCGFAFLAGAVLTWLPLRATIRNLRAELSRPTTRPALAAGTVIIPTQPTSTAAAGSAPTPTLEADPVEEPEESGEAVAAEEVVQVKGSAKSMIFHTPDSPYFKRMKGDVTFRSIAEAEEAGYTRWRPKSAAAQAR